jgi:DNA-binding transcriptional LysR family regulator
MSNIWTGVTSYLGLMDRDIELRHLRYFAAVAEELNFTRAAARLNIAQPALSQQIRQLETRLGTALFARVPRVALTRAGAAFLPAARRALAQVRQAAVIAERVGAGHRAVLHIGLTSGGSMSRFPQVVREFMELHSDIAVRLSEMHSTDQIEALRSGALDVGIVREAVIDQPFTTREILREPLRVVLPARHPLAAQRSVALADCADEPFILFPRSGAPTMFDQIANMCREAGFTPRVETEAHEWHTIAALVAAGFGISIAPASVTALRVRGSVVRRLLPATKPTALFVCTAAESNSDVVTTFVEFVVETMRVRETAGAGRER